jgi:glycerophosphoryl diester phosphodiesterase
MDRSWPWILVGALLGIGLALPGAAGARVANVAHKGSYETAPEATIPAYTHAFTLGRADWAECDLRETADGVLVCQYQDDIALVSNCPGRLISTSTLAELQACDFGCAYSPAYCGTGVTIATVEEVLAVANQYGKKIIFDTKFFGRNKAQKIRQILDAHGWPQSMVIQWNRVQGEPAQSNETADWNTWLPDGAVIYGNDLADFPESKLVQRAAAGDLGIASPIFFLDANPGWVELAHSHGLQVFAYLEIGPSSFSHVVGLDVDAVLQGYPQQFASFLDGFACTNGLDDDGDTLSDFPADLGCIGNLDTNETDEPACNDGRDNDGDGLEDAQDPGCTGASDPSEREATLPCDNGVDDDGDTRTDFPADSGCTSASDTSEKQAGRVCDDGLDNDGDGSVDFPQDLGCKDTASSKENPACSNGVNDDGEGGTDWNGAPRDADCYNMPWKDSETPYKNRLIYIVHRGGSLERPENTLISFEHGMGLGADWIECDVRKTLDNQLVCIHDATVDRTTDGTGAVKNFTLAQLQALSACEAFCPAYAEARVPTLAEVLLAARGRAIVFLEPKDFPLGAQIKALLTSLGLEDDAVAAWADFTAVTLDFKNNLPGSKVILRNGLADTLAEAQDLVAQVKSAGYWGASIDVANLFNNPIGQQIVDTFHAQGVPLVVLVANSALTIDPMYALGVDGISTLSPTNMSQRLGMPDADFDRIFDDTDNCLGTSNTNQRDTNGDGYGNACDADLDDDGIVNLLDIAAFRNVFLSNNADADLNGDGTVNLIDLATLRARLFQAPGPSADAP